MCSILQIERSLWLNCKNILGVFNIKRFFDEDYEVGKDGIILGCYGSENKENKLTNFNKHLGLVLNDLVNKPGADIRREQCKVFNDINCTFWSVAVVDSGDNGKCYEEDKVSGSNVQEWDHDDIDAWPKQCLIGENQSPIDINPCEVKKQDEEAIHCFNYDRPHKTTMQNTGYTVELKFVDQEKYPITISKGILTDEYILHNIHFHWDSEHTINEKRFVLEAHFVHYLKKAGSLQKALKTPKGMVVLSVLFKISNEATKAFKDITKDVKKIANKIEQPINVQPFCPKNLLPDDTKTFYSYKGSLTTPNCTEGVKWIVFEQISKISKKELDSLKKIYDHDNNEVTHNYRPIQKLNGRKVLYVHSN